MRRFFLFVLGGAFIMVFQSCKKETPDTESQAAVDNGICENEFSSRLNLINSLAVRMQGIKSNGSFEPAIHIDSFPRKLTIDFGNIGMTDSIDGDNRIRKGKIIATFDTLWHITNAKAIVKLVDYYVSTDGGASFIKYSVDSIVIKKNGLGAFTNNINGGKCVGTNFRMVWSSNRSVNQISGVSTPFDLSDDIFESVGSSFGVDRNGKSYKVTITSPLIKPIAFPYIIAGILKLTPDGLPVRIVDYGNGAFDNKATLSINGNVFSFRLN